MIAIGGRFGEKPHHQVRQRCGHLGPELGYAGCKLGEVSVHEGQRILAPKRKLTREHLVERHSERVEVRPVVDGAARSTGLFGRQIGDSPLLDPDRVFLRQLRVHPRGEPEIDDLEDIRVRIEHQVGRIDVAMHYAARVHLANSFCDADRELQKSHNGQPGWAALLPLSQPEIERGSPEVLQDEHGRLAIPFEAPRSYDPGRLEPPEYLVLLFVSGERVGFRKVGLEDLEDDGDFVAQSDRSVGSRAGALVQGLPHLVAGEGGLDVRR